MRIKVATRDIRSGEVILIDASLVAAHADRTSWHHCLRPAAGVPCAGVGCGMRYCSAKCRDEAQAAYHAPLCGVDTRALDERVGRGKLASSRFVLLAFKLLGMALTRRAAAGSEFLPAAPADMPPVRAIWRMTDDRAEPAQMPTFTLDLWH
jgi:hypothetical protein